MLANALEHLQDLIDNGTEFPDAVWQVTQKFKLSTADVVELESIYN